MREGAAVEHWVPFPRARAGTSVASLKQVCPGQITESGDLLWWSEMPGI